MSYSLLPALNSYHRLTVLEQQPKTGYRFFLSPNGKYGHHMLIHKTGRFLGAVRENGAYNLHEALAYHGGPSAFLEITSEGSITNGAATAFHKALQDPSVQFLVQAVAVDIATAARDIEILKFIVKFINQSELPVVCVESHNGIDLVMNKKTVVSISAPKSPDLLTLLTQHQQAIEARTQKALK